MSLVKQPTFVSLFSIDSKKKYRFAYEELSLRFIAFSEKFEKYDGRLSKWLNSYMYDNRNKSDIDLNLKREEFDQTIALIYNRVLNKSPLIKTSKSVIEGLYVGINRNLKTHLKSNEDLSHRFEVLKKDVLYSTESLKEGVAQKARVIKRLTKAVEIFA